MAQTSAKKYPLSSKDYELYEEIGEGVSATVYRALCIPFNEIIAIKVLDLEKCNSDLVCHPLQLYPKCASFILYSLNLDMVFVSGCYFYCYTFWIYAHVLLPISC